MQIHMHVLLVEDDESHALLVRHCLRKIDFATILLDWVKDGDEALGFIKRCAVGVQAFPDLILLDIKMPGLDGHEVVRTIRENKDFERVPIVMLSSSAADDDVARALHHRANGYLVKPMTVHDFLAMLKSLIEYWGRWNVRSGTGESEAVERSDASPILYKRDGD